MTYFLINVLFLCFSSKLRFSRLLRGSYVSPMFLLCSSYDPIVPERTYNGFATDLQRTYCYGIKGYK